MKFLKFCIVNVRKIYGPTQTLQTHHVYSTRGVFVGKLHNIGIFTRDFRPCEKLRLDLPRSWKKWSWGKYNILRNSPYSVLMRENKEQNNSEYGHFSRIAYLRRLFS